MSLARRRAIRALGPGAVALAAAAMLAPSPAAARGFVAFSFGFPLVAGPAYYYPRPAYYYPPPLAYYYPPPAYPVAPPVAYAPAPPAYSAYGATSAPQECREYQTTTMIGGVPQPAFGTACREPDGTWRIIR